MGFALSIAPLESLADAAQLRIGELAVLPGDACDVAVDRGGREKGGDGNSESGVLHSEQGTMNKLEIE